VPFPGFVEPVLAISIEKVPSGDTCIIYPFLTDTACTNGRAAKLGSENEQREDGRAFYKSRREVH
jgi:hypothetical protein